MKRKFKQSKQQSTKKTKNENTDYKPQKIFISGSINGNFSQLFKEIEKDNYDLAFCVGNFCCSRDQETKKNDIKYIKGEISVPVPTYIIDSGLSYSFLNKIPNGGKIVNNLHFLGRGTGIINIHGFNIAYICGKYDPHAFKNSHIKEIHFYHHEDIQRIEEDSEFTSIDLLFSTELPFSVFNGLQPLAIPKFKIKSETFSIAVTRLVKKLKPRYHFISNNENVYFERLPYVHEKSITKLIHLSSISSKQKHFYTLDIKPYSVMNFKERREEKPSLFTNSPFI